MRKKHTAQHTVIDLVCCSKTSLLPASQIVTEYTIKICLLLKEQTATDINVQML